MSDNKIYESEFQEKCISAVVSEEHQSERLDVFIPSVGEGMLSRSKTQALIVEGRVTVNGKVVDKPSYKVKPGDVVLVRVPPVEKKEIKAEEIPLDIIYEDEDVIVVNKPRGMVVHPAAGHWEGTLVNALLGYYPEIEGVGRGDRPGIVHRLDKDTTGLILVAKNERALAALQRQMKTRAIKREYIVLCRGSFKEDLGTVNAPLGRHPRDRKRMAVIKDVGSGKGREAVTDWQVINRFGSDYTLIKANLRTGRTHQIRVHMSYIGHPVVGDPVYGNKTAMSEVKGQLLHAFRLGLFLGEDYDQYKEFTAPLPDDFRQILLQLEHKYGEEIPSWVIE